MTKDRMTDYVQGQTWAGEDRVPGLLLSDQLSPLLCGLSECRGKRRREVRQSPRSGPLALPLILSKTPEVLPQLQSWRKTESLLMCQ